MTDRLTDITDSLERGERLPAEQLLPLLYDELRELARARLRREPPGQTLQATDVVNEAYLRIVAKGDPGWDGRGHLFGALAQAMRRVMVDRARARSRKKRGGDRNRIEFNEEVAVLGAGAENAGRLEALDESLTRLEQLDARKATIVLLKFFAGRSAQEIALMLDVSQRTVEREWEFARVWLFSDMSQSDGTAL